MVSEDAPNPPEALVTTTLPYLHTGKTCGTTQTLIYLPVQEVEQEPSVVADQVQVQSRLWPRAH